ncbi:MAG: FAD-dependent thymidylate synthase [Anaerolineae bacterium]
MEVKLIAITKYLAGNGSPEELIEHAGRVCYRSEPKGSPGRFIRRRVSEGHESIIEHASATFEISGISRACSHQLVRHRIASYSQESQRYVDMSNPEYVLPPSIADNEAATVAFGKLTEAVSQAYKELRALEIPKEDARFVLPNAAATRIVVTMNFRSWRHVIRERALNPGAQWEISELASRVLDALHEAAPNVFQDLVDERARLQTSRR